MRLRKNYKRRAVDGIGEKNGWFAESPPLYHRPLNKIKSFSYCTFLYMVRPSLLNPGPILVCSIAHFVQY